MSYSYFRILIYFSVFTINILLSFSVQAESENSVSDISEQEIILDNSDDDELEDDIYSEEEICPEDETEVVEIDESFLSILDGPQEYVSSSVELMARNMDEFFTTNRDFYETSGSYLSLKQNVLFRERGDRKSVV